MRVYDNGSLFSVSASRGPRLHRQERQPPLGTIVHKQAPMSRGRYLDPRDPRAVRSFAPVRYRVRMLDGSLWHGYGPSSNGNYIRLYRMKGA